jgi:hypothetical protein
MLILSTNAGIIKSEMEHMLPRLDSYSFMVVISKIQYSWDN